MENPFQLKHPNEAGYDSTLSRSDDLSSDEPQTDSIN